MLQLNRRACLLVAIFLSASAVAARAQGVDAHSWEIAGNAGVDLVDSADSSGHPSFGASGGYNFTRHVALLGEYHYLFVGDNAKTQVYDAAFRYSWRFSERTVPYIVAGLGANRPVEEYSDGYHPTGAYVTVAGGVSFYVNKNWGIRTELREESQNYPARYPSPFSSPIFDTVVTLRGTVSLFYQWGGRTRY